MLQTTTGQWHCHPRTLASICVPSARLHPHATASTLNANNCSTAGTLSKAPLRPPAPGCHSTALKHLPTAPPHSLYMRLHVVA